MATVQLTGDFSEAVTTTNVEVADTRSITLRLLSRIILSNGDIHDPQRWIVPLVSGAFSRYLVVPDVSTQAGSWSATLPDGTETAFSLASTNGPVADLSTILLTNQLAITPNALAVLLATYTPLATYTAAVAALQADINTRLTAATAAGLFVPIARTWISLAPYLGAGWVVGSGFAGYRPAVEYAVVGTCVYLRGMVTRSSGTAALASGLPLAIRPAYTHFIPVGTEQGYGQVDISTAGALTVRGSGGVNPIEFTAWSFYELT